MEKKEDLILFKHLRLNWILMLVVFLVFVVKENLINQLNLKKMETNIHLDT